MRTLVIVFVLLTLLVPIGWSQGEEGGPSGLEVELEGSVEGGEEHAEEEGWSAVAFRWVNFLILFGGLGYLLRQPAADFLKTRTALIQGGLQRAQAAKGEADDRMSEIEARLSAVSSEVNQIRSEADRSASVEKERIVSDAQAESHRAVAQSGAEVERIAKGLEQKVRAEVADLVILKAEEQLRSKMTDADRERSVRRVVDKI